MLKRLVKRNKFRRILLMDEQTSHSKLDLVVALNHRIKEMKGFTNLSP